jgi:hypothetical protein
VCDITAERGQCGELLRGGGGVVSVLGRQKCGSYQRWNVRENKRMEVCKNPIRSGG